MISRIARSLDRRFDGEHAFDSRDLSSVSGQNNLFTRLDTPNKIGQLSLRLADTAIRMIDPSRRSRRTKIDRHLVHVNVTEDGPESLPNGCWVIMEAGVQWARYAPRYD